MPRKGEKRGRKRGKGTQQPATSTTPTTNATPAPRRSIQQSAGRSTNNSRGNRVNTPRRQLNRKGIAKKNGRGRKGAKKENSHLSDPNFYKGENGEVYRPGDFAYVDSQQADLPYHICVIRDFKLARKDSVMAEVKWFYRVSELPEAVYLLLMEDRKKDQDAAMFEDPQVKERELFLAFNVDTHQASLFRGKCQLKLLSEVSGGLSDYIKNKDSFFYHYGYKPESRRLTDINEESIVPHSQQAELPECISSNNPDKSPSPEATLDRYSMPEEKVHGEELTWKPHLSDDQLLMYLRAARSIALHAGVYMNGYIAEGYLAASSDETTQHAFDVLHRNGHSVDLALQDLVKRPIVSHLVGKKNWSKESTVLFAKGMRQFGKNFHKIKKELLPDKEITELTEYYYYWKKTNAGLSSRGMRRQRKQSHIRMGKQVMKLRDPTPEREFMDWASCDEEEGEGEDGEKGQSFYACRHCYTTDSPNWHHAGVDRTILCQDCRLYFQQYGYMRALKEKREPPEFMFKDYHESLVADEQTQAQPLVSTATTTSGRKTRNSNGSRLSSRPGLRSGKNYNKSDTDEEGEAEASDVSESSSEEEVVPVSKPKVLQARRSLLDNLDENFKQTEEPPAKRPKMEDENEANESEEEGSGESTNGEGDRDSSHKSPDGEKSPSHSVTSSQGDEDRGDFPSTSSDPLAASMPQQFERVSKDKDRESTCARTELVYIHPPPEVKKMATAATKIPVVPPLNIPHPHSHAPSSSHAHPSDHPSATPRVPIITPHAPQLPMGPGPFMGFPMAIPMTPLSATTPVLHEAASRMLLPRANSLDAAAVAREQEHQQQQQIALWQQQQWVQAQAQAHQKQLELHSQFPNLVPPPPSALPQHPPGVNFPPQPGPPAGPPHSQPQASIEHAPRPHPSSQSQPVAFTFPTPDEVARQRVMQIGFHEHPLIPHPGVALPPGMPPTFLLESMGPIPRPDEHGARGPIPTPHFVPHLPNMPGAVNLELLAQHQAAAVGMSPSILPPLPDNMMEFQRQIEAVMQQVQKDPSLINHPQVQYMMNQHQRLMAVAQAQAQAQAQEQSLMMQLNYQRAQEAMIQQHQQEMQMGRPADDGQSRGIRPGVIVQPK